MPQLLLGRVHCVGVARRAWPMVPRLLQAVVGTISVGGGALVIAKVAWNDEEPRRLVHQLCV